MPNDKLTIKQVKEKKVALESDILKMVQDFESETGVKINYLDLQRSNLNKSSSAPTAMEDEYKPGPIENVDARAEFDLIY